MSRNLRGVSFPFAAVCAVRLCSRSYRLAECVCAAAMPSCRYLMDNESWLQEHLESFLEDDYIVIDCPGQIELYSHVPVMKRVGYDSARVRVGIGVRCRCSTVPPLARLGPLVSRIHASSAGTSHWISTALVRTCSSGRWLSCYCLCRSSQLRA